MRRIDCGLTSVFAALALWLPTGALAQEGGEPPMEEAPADEPAEPAPPPAEEPAASGTIKYDKGTVIASPDGAFSLKIVGRLQPRWELARVSGDGAEIAHRFLVARGRVTLEGVAFSDVDYKFQTEFGRGFTFLRDYYLDKGIGSMRVRVGQYKRPYSRQQIMSSGNLQLVDRSPTDSFSGAGRDIGVMVHNYYEKSADGIEWAVGVFNGTGDRGTVSCSGVDDGMGGFDVSCGLPSNVPADIGPTVVARVGYNNGGIKGYSESDLEGGPMRLAVGASYMGALAEGESDAMQHRAEADFMIKASGASLTGGVYLLNQKVAGETQNDVGLHVQGGYFLTPKQFEAAARFSMVPAGDDDTLEILGGFNWFREGHALKWQTDAGILRTTSDPAVTTLVVRTQAQLIF